jgi:predicted enzyme related to lactoylglutathione lyase
MRLKRTILFVTDLPRLVDFYERLFGRAPVEGTRTDGWAEFDLGGSLFALHSTSPEQTEGSAAGAERRIRTETPFKPVFETADADAARCRIEALGGSALPRPWGTVDFADPEGNVFGVVGVAR